MIAILACVSNSLWKSGNHQACGSQVIIRVVIILYQIIIRVVIGLHQLITRVVPAVRQVIIRVVTGIGHLKVVMAFTITLSVSVP